MSSNSRSGIIRQAIGPVNSRLRSHVTRVEEILSRRIPEQTSECVTERDDVSELRGKIKSCIETLESKDAQWQRLVLSLENVLDREAEEEIFQETAFSQSGGFLNNVQHGKETLCSIDRRNTELQRQIDLLSQSQVTRGQTTVGADRSFVSAKLPKLTLPTFSGDHLEWPKFWSIFKVNINDRCLSSTEKFAYLIGLLNGPALRCIDGLTMTDDNYHIAVGILKERYEQTPTQLVSMLYSKLKRMPKCSNRVSELLRTYDDCEKIFRQLVDVGEGIDQNRSLVLDTLSKYPAEVVKDMMNVQAVGPDSTLKQVRSSLHDHIKRVCHYENMMDDLQPFEEKCSIRRKPSDKGDERHSGTGQPIPLTSALVSSNRSPPSVEKPGKPCYFCTGEHFNSRCIQFQTAEQRLERLIEQNRCTVCLSAKHSANSCPLPKQRLRCFFCKKDGDHVSPLCPVKFGKGEYDRGGSQVNKNPETTASTLLNTSEEAFLMTASTVIRNPLNGAELAARVIFDSGSHRSYVTDACAASIGLTSRKNEQLEVAIFGTHRTLTVPSQQVQIELKTKRATWKLVDTHTTPIITNCSIRPVNLSLKDKEFIDSLNVSRADEPSARTSASIDILLGSDYFWDFVGGPTEVLPSGLHFISSDLGGLIAGRCETQNPGGNHQVSSLLCVAGRSSSDLLEAPLDAFGNHFHSKSPDIDEYWRLETIGIADDPVLNEDDEALQQFNDTVYYDQGRYHVKWPWKLDPANLPSNYELALGRFKSLAKRLFQNDSTILSAYTKVIDDQRAKGVIEPVPKADSNGDAKLGVAPIHYLPHHPVLKPSSSTTKVRVVYDASAKTKKGNPSLNESMLRGPMLLPDLCGILIRFRFNKIAMVADVEKAFLQLSLQSHDRDVTRFFWLKDPTKREVVDNLVEYRFCRVPFGIISSPFLLNATIQYHLKQQRSWVAKRIFPNMYVDNVIAGVDDVASGKEFYDTANDIFSRAGMHLQEWCTNEEDVTRYMNHDDRTMTTEIKVLGMIWDSREDTLRITAPVVIGKTKRQILRTVASVYDPLGLFQPVLLRAKLFLQKLWLHNKSWDEILDDIYIDEWKQILHDYQSLSGVKIQRCPNPFQASSQMSIVTFCDASISSYSAVVYLRVQRTLGCWSSSIVFSKSRLAPRKRSQETVSLPRLELLGVLIGVRASLFVRRALRSFTQDTIPVCIFTDSSCVLYWLRSPKPLSVFVENRVKEIRSTDVEVFHVKTDENPADIGTRGKCVDELVSSFWWRGPTWLEQDRSEWPATLPLPLLSVEAAVAAETKGRAEIFHTILVGPTNQPLPLGIPILHFSSLSRLLRISAFCLKFLKRYLWNNAVVSRARLPVAIIRIFNTVADTPYISPNDLRASTRMWILRTQNHHYADVKVAFHQETQHKLIKQLCIKVDDDGLLRCGGRLRNAEIAMDAIEPVLLAKNDAFTTLIIRDAHERLFHAGVGHTLSQVRQQYWIPHGRVAVRSVIKRCSICKRFKGAAFALPPMPPWPRERVSRSSPFEYTGLDYFGPINVKGDEGTTKMWVCLFTCLAMRAIHLEVVPDCTAKEFLNCVIRFVSRRGTPAVIISDNAPQFRVTKTIFDRVWHEILVDETVRSYSANRGIGWKFTTELAPWQGGFYERLVGLVKGSFRAAIGRRLLSYPELLTVSAEVEAVVNTRPITYVYSDFSSGRSLCPMDFITDLPVGIPPTETGNIDRRNIGEAGRNLVHLWKMKQTKLNAMWEFWTNEYLLSLRERYQQVHKGKRGEISSRHPDPDEVVLIKDSDLPRGCWKLGRIVQVIAGRDGSVRSAEVKLANGTIIKRPINHLFSLEMDPPKTEPSVEVVADETAPLEDHDFQGFTEDEIRDAEERHRQHREHLPIVNNLAAVAMKFYFGEQ